MFNHPDVDSATGRVYSGSMPALSIKECMKIAEEHGKLGDNFSGSFKGITIDEYVKMRLNPWQKSEVDKQ